VRHEIELNPFPPKSKSTKQQHSFDEVTQDKNLQRNSSNPRTDDVTANDHPNKHFKSSPTNQKQYLRFTAQLLEEVEWLRFEALCSAYFTEIGIKNRLTGLGADGGIDIKIFGNDFSQVVAIVQCKKVSNPVSVNLLREFYGVMVSQKVNKGYFITSNTFHNGAIAFAKDLNIELINGQALLKRINQLSQTAQTSIVKVATLGDYKTASCVKCGTKMRKRLNQQTKKQFWACPKSNCRTTLRIKNN